MLHLILAQATPIIGGGFDWPNITITVNSFVPLILIGVGILWHRGRGPRH